MPNRENDTVMTMRNETKSNNAASLDEAILAEKIFQTYGAYFTSAIAIAVNAVILVIIMWPVINHRILLIWLLALLSLTILRGYYSFKFRKRRPLPTEAPLWYRKFLIGSLLSAALWGGASIMLFPKDDFARQIFLAFVMGGMGAGAVTSLTYFKLPFYIFLSCTMVPLILQFFFDATGQSDIMGLMLVLYFIMLSIAANRSHINLNQNIILKSEGLVRERSLQDSEYRYRTLLETATDAFFLYNLKGKLLDANQQTCESLGYSHEELLELTISDIKVTANLKELSKLRHSLENEGNIQYESVYRRKDGTTFPVEVSIGLIKMGDERLYSVLARNVTERKRAEAHLLASKLEAEKANAAKSEFLSRMSHEFRTPMNAILGFAQLLQMNERELNAIQQSNVTEILDAGHHLLYLINEVLDLAKIESGKLDVIMAETAISDVIRQCIPLIKGKAEIRNVKLIDNISDKDFIILADGTRLKQVILNLLSNAVKYNRDNGQVTLDAERTDQEKLRIKISDTGNGLTKAEIARLYTPFERINETNNIEGAGIGLVITKHLTELMGGTIGVESHVGEGSVFWVEFTLVNQKE